MKAEYLNMQGDRGARVYLSRGAWSWRLLGLLGLAGLALGSGMRALAWGATTIDGLSPAATSTSAAPPLAPLVFDGVTVVDVEQGRLLPDQRVVIVGTRIKHMGGASTVRVPAGARVVDARGKYLIPGLWDLHAHPNQFPSHDPNSALRWHHDIAIVHPLLIANGVTGIRDAGSTVPLDTLKLWRRQILAGTRVGPPRQILSGHALDEETPCRRGYGKWAGGHTCVIDEDDARHVVDSLKKDGADMLKMYNLSTWMYFVIAAEARKIGIPFGGHINNKMAKITAIEASDSGASILDHVNAAGDLDELCLGKDASVDRCQPVAEHFRRNNTWWVPTLIVEASLVFGTPENMRVGRLRVGRPLGPASLAILRRFYQFVDAFWAGSELHLTGLREAASGAQPPQPAASDAGNTLHIVHSVGLPILAGTDFFLGKDELARQPPGFCLHAELALYVAEGLTPLEALQTATLNPAKLLHATDSLGTVAPGKLADLVLLDADPLQDIANTTAIRGVVANGRYFDRAALDQLLADVRTTAKQPAPPRGPPQQPPPLGP